MGLHQYFLFQTHSSSFRLVPYNHLFETGISLPHILIIGICAQKGIQDKSHCVFGRTEEPNREKNFLSLELQQWRRNLPC